MLAGDAAVLDDLCSDDLIYTHHSKADYDDKRSYLHQVGTRYFTYLEQKTVLFLVIDKTAMSLSSACEATGTPIELPGAWLVTDLCWPGLHALQAVVAHLGTP